MSSNNAGTYMSVNKGIYYGKYSAGSWSTFSGLDTQAVPAMGTWTALANTYNEPVVQVNASNLVSIGYQFIPQSGNPQILVKSQNGSGGWVSNTVHTAATSDVAYFVRDSAGQLSLAYYDTTSGQKDYYVANSANWASSNLILDSSTGNLYTLYGLATDSANKLHALYQFNNQASFGEISNTSGTWTAPVTTSNAATNLISYAASTSYTNSPSSFPQDRLIFNSGSLNSSLVIDSNNNEYFLTKNYTNTTVIPSYEMYGKPSGGNWIRGYTNVSDLNALTSITASNILGINLNVTSSGLMIEYGYKPTPNTYKYISGLGSDFVAFLSTNTAPTFTNATTTLTITEDATATDIKSLLTVSDSDSSQTETWSQSAAPSNGTLSFSSATASSGSTSITSGGTITYTPTANYSGSDSFTVQVSDGTATATRTISVTVNPVNDAPAGTDKTLSTTEDSTYNFSTADFGFTDPNDTPANVLNRVKITTLPVAGTLNWDGAPVVAGNSYTASSIASKLAFTPAANANGTNYASFTFQVEDDGGVANSGVNLDASPNTLTINVTSINDAPVLSLTGANAYAAINNTPVSIFTSATTVSDIEGNYNGGTLVASISASSQTADKLAFTGSGITISSGNVAVNGTTIGTVSPVAGSATSTNTLTVTFNTNATSALIEQLVEGLQFSTTATGSARTVSVTLTDNGTVNSGSGTQTAIVSSISNTAPTFNNDVTGTAGTLDSTLPINENATQTDISNLLAVTDADSGQTLTWSISTAPTKGTLTGFTSATGISNGGTVTPSGLYYTPTSNNVGSDSFVIQVSDGFGGTKTVTVPVTIANVLPVLGNSLLAGISENATSFGVTVGTATATQDTNGITYSITAGNTGNKFSINSSTGVITTLAALDYETTSQYVLTIRATDESSATSDALFTIPVLNVAEAPVNTVPGAKTTLEDTPLVITGLSVSDVDSASLTTVLSVASGTGTLNVASGSGATVTNSGSATVTISGTLTQINAALAAVTYTPTANANGNSYATLTMKTYDGTSSAADLATAVTSTVAINVTSVVDAPLVISGATTTAEDTQSGVITIAKAAVDGAEVTHFKVTELLTVRFIKMTVQRRLLTTVSLQPLKQQALNLHRMQITTGQVAPFSMCKVP
ncbi:MAG: cadherin-like domain-containing protein [Methylococcales bacterium]|nr:cadherin-like domain-containing protein [Methylococcales bacterium]